MFKLDGNFIGDPWFYIEGETAHMWFLTMPASMGREQRWKHWDIGYAVSTDLIHWEYQGIALSRGEDDCWDSQKLATGSVIKRDGLYRMAYTGHRKNFLNIQYAGMAYSEDLEHWTKLSDNPTSEPDNTIYDQGNRDNPPYSSHWRDPFMVQDGETVYALTCAQEKECDPDIKGVVGLSQSNDMKTWELLPPLETDRMARQMECPNIHHINGMWYLVFSCSPGMIADSFKEQFPDLTFGSSIFSMTSDSMFGPYIIHGTGLVREPNSVPVMYAGQLVCFRDMWYIMGFQIGEDWFPAEAIADPIPVEATETGIKQAKQI